MLKIVLFVTTLFTCQLVNIAVAQDLKPLEQLKTCARITLDAERIACFEALGKAALQTEQQEDLALAETSQLKPADKPTEPEPAAAVQALPDSIGGGEFAGEDGKQKQSYRGKVVSCKKSADRRWFYIFDNDQVWKQVDRRNRRHKDCNFEVTLIKDNFGYTMEIDGQDSKIRVDRRR